MDDEYDSTIREPINENSRFSSSQVYSDLNMNFQDMIRNQLKDYEDIDEDEFGIIDEDASE